MTAFQIFTQPSQQALDTAANVLSGATLTFSLTGSSTATNAYSDSTLLTPVANPLSANSAGVWIPVFLDPAVTYRIVLKTSAGSVLQTWDPANEQILTALAVGLLLFPRTTAEVAASITPTSYLIPSHESIGVFRIERYGGGVGIAAATNVTAITSATAVASAAGGGTVLFPAGTINTNNRLTPLTNVIWEGAGPYATTLNCTMANGVATSNIWIDARGTGLGGFPLDRKIIRIADMTLDGVGAGNQVKCLALGWNMRSMPLLRNVRIRRFADYGVGFLDQNWNISFENVEMDTCGSTVANSTGWYKDPAVDAGTFNYINWYNCITEACGSASSAAGGMNLQTTTANRGFAFIACEWENNRGTDQVLITKTADVYMNAPYIEMPTGAAEAVTGMEFSGCTGSIDGGFITAADANNLRALQFKANCQMSIRNLHFGTTWATSSVDVQSSVIENRNCLKAVGTMATFTLDASAEIYGDVQPFWYVTTSADQTGIVNNTVTKVSWQTESDDLTACFDNATNFRATPRTRGWYSNDVQVRWDTNVTAFDQYHIFIEVNGSIVGEKLVRPSELAAFEHTAHFDVKLTSQSDFIEIFVRHVDGGAPANRTLKTGSTVTWWKGQLTQVKVA